MPHQLLVYSGNVSFQNKTIHTIKENTGNLLDAREKLV
jgi:hypothetical protein